jgi:hypothetical protein
MLSEGQREYVADLSKNFASVLFGGAFASELLLKLSMWARLAMMAAMGFFIALGFWAARRKERV